MSKDKVNEQAIWAGAALLFGVVMVVFPKQLGWWDFEKLLSLATAAGTVGAVIWAVWLTRQQDAERILRDKQMAYLYSIGYRDKIESDIAIIKSEAAKAIQPFEQDVYAELVASTRLNALMSMVERCKLYHLQTYNLERMWALPAGGAYQIHHGLACIRSAMDEIREPSRTEGLSNTERLMRVHHELMLSLLHLQSGLDAIQKLENELMQTLIPGKQHLF